MEKEITVGRNWSAENEELKAKCSDLEETLQKVASENEELRAKCRHYEMMFNDAERNRQILAAQMDVVRMIFG